MAACTIARSYFGALYEATGPGFAGPSIPRAVTRRQVGNMRSISASTRRVDYTIDGVTVSKQVRPFAFRLIDLSGGTSATSTSPRPASGPESPQRGAMTIQDDGTTLQHAESSETPGSCTLRRDRGQSGQVSMASGTSRPVRLAGQRPVLDGGRT
jgi:hypothetical protein